MNSQRINYSPYTLENLLQILPLLQDELNNLYTCFPKNNDNLINKKLLHYISSSSTKAFLLFSKSSNELLGYISIHSISKIHQFASLTYILDFKHQNKGYMKEALNCIIDYAFNKLQLFRLEAQVSVNNSASVHLLKSLSFTQEARMRKNFMIQGALQDSFLFSLLKSEYNFETSL